MPHSLPSRAGLRAPVQPLIMLQLRINSAPDPRLRLIFIDAIVPCVYCTCALGSAPSVPGSC